MTSGHRSRRKGSVVADRIVSSNLRRAVQTATAISKATGIPVSDKTDGLHPWHLGEMEGQPTDKVLKRINDLVTKRPNERVPGRGPKSTAEGEPFNGFKRRFLGTMSKLMKHHETNPNDRTIAVSHYRGGKLTEAWARKGFPKDFSIDTPHMTGTGSPPGSVQHLRKSAGGKWKLSPADMKHGGRLKPGIYLVRHGSTSWNQENGGGEPDEIESPGPVEK